MNDTFIALGKNGDLLSVLPILYQAHREQKSPVRLLTSHPYNLLVEGTSYIESSCYSGHFDDLRGAILSVKRQGRNAIPLQVFGKDFPCQKRTPSFQYDQWQRTGAAGHFYDWPLVIDRRNRTRETALLKQVCSKKPLILFADYSESSPFEYTEQIADGFRERYGQTHQLIRLSGIRAQRFYDFLALYNHSVLLVTIETAHLHLSRAAQVPVIALVNDLPTRWHGSAWHPRFAFHCRYNNFELREAEMWHRIEGILNGANNGIETETLNCNSSHSYNPTVLEGSEVLIYRRHPTRNWKTVLMLEHKGLCGQLNFPDKGFQECSQEDARLFWFRDKLHLSFVLAEKNAQVWNSIVGYGELTEDGNTWRVGKLCFPKFGRNDWTGMEKNWLFFEQDRRLFFIYGNNPEQTVVEVEDESPKRVYTSPALKWPYGEIRGGCLTRHGDHLLRFFHSHTTDGARDNWIYFIGAALMESQPPFRTLAISKVPILSGNEKWNPDCFHWKQNVVFPGGVTRFGRGWKLVYGVNDCECASAYLSEKDLNL